VEIEIFTVCDFAQDNGGKLTIVGTFDRITPPAYPYVHPAFGIACRLRFSQNELGRHHLQIKVSSPENQEVLANIEGDINVAATPNAEFSAFNLAVNFHQTQFQERGVYPIQLFVDGEWRTGLKLTLA
jgi:hypothetical protein